jgi:hypothetical protein
MAVTAFGWGTQVAVIGSEHQLTNINTNGVFQFSVDCNAMTATDVLELRIYKVIITGGTPRVLYELQICGAQDTDNMIVVSKPFDNDLTNASSLRVTLKQSFGTGRSYKWKVLKLQPA